MLKFVFLAISFLAFSLKPATIFAYSRQSIVNLVVPVRGREGWTDLKQSPLSLPLFVHKEATPSAIPITWLLRYDALKEASVSAVFQGLTATDSSQLLGAYLEITPSLVEKAQVINGVNSHLVSFSVADRKRLIDTYMETFRQRFSVYPTVAAADYLDANSLSYLSTKYPVRTVMMKTNSYQSSGERIWGGPLNSPFIPQRTNSLQPSASKNTRLNLAVVPWQTLNPSSVDRNGSALAIDWLDPSLDLDWAFNLSTQKDLNEVSQLSLVLANDLPLDQYRGGIASLFAYLKKNRNIYNFNDLFDFGQYFLTFYPVASPPSMIKVYRPGTDKLVELWYQNAHYRIGLAENSGQTVIKDLRLINPGEADPFYSLKNTLPLLTIETPAVIDPVKAYSASVVLDLNLSTAELRPDRMKLDLVSEGKSLTFDQQSITFKNLTPPEIANRQIVLKKNQGNSIWQFNPLLPLDTSSNQKLISLAIFTLPFILLLTHFRPYLKALPRQLVFILLPVLALPLLTVIRSGRFYPFGLGFWGPNGHDAIFHLSLINHFFRHPFSLDHPQLAGGSIRNYHFGLDYLTALLERIFNFPLLDLFFRYLPVLLLTSLLFLTLKLLQYWRYSTLGISLGIFLAFLTGSLGFIPGLLAKQTLFTGESVFWANQSVSLLLNPPFTFSLILMLIFFTRFKEPLTKGRLIFLSVVAGLLAPMKIYAFILLLTGLLLTRRIKLLSLSAVIGFVFLLPGLDPSGSPFVFAPLWFQRSMVEAVDRLNLGVLAQAWQAYEATGNLPKLLAVNVIAFIIFIAGNLSLRLFGFLNIRAKENPSSLLALLISLIGLVIPILFIQAVNPWNAIQFLYYSLFFLGLLSGRPLADIVNRLPNFWSKSFVILLIFILSIPTTIGTLADYLTPSSAARVSYPELHALQFLKEQPLGVVLSLPFSYLPSPKLAEPKPLYGYTSTAYISALSGQPEFLSDTINLDITGFDYQERVKDIQRFFNTADSNWARQFLISNQISYLYQTPMAKINFPPQSACLDLVFDSGEINIYKLNCNEN
ncbi:hypothetical protein HY333_01035 [Candidatus Collierbacteria bacterium]|nr:hypothetical protein [Candidatus Collierbacteria bacterium]